MEQLSLQPLQPHQLLNFHFLKKWKTYLCSNQGFTLMEMLVVLTIWSVLITVTLSANSKLWEEHQVQSFLKLLQEDVLYMQEVQMTTFKNLRLFIDQDQISYQIREGGTGNVYVSRDYPNNWQIELRTLQMPIEFSIKGAIKKPGSMILRTTSHDYLITFPLGRGRMYVTER